MAEVHRNDILICFGFFRPIFSLCHSPCLAELRTFFEKVILLNLRKVTCKLDVGECLLLDANNLPGAVIVHLYRSHHHQIRAILCWFNFESDKLRFLPVPARNTSEK